MGEVIQLQPKQDESTDAYAGSKNDSVVYFVDLKNAEEEVLVRVTPEA